MNFAVFVSGNGSNLQAIIDAKKKGVIKSELALVFSNKRKAYALKRAEQAGIEKLFLNPKDYATPQSYERDIVIQLKDRKIDFIVCAGYMKIFTPFFIKKFKNQIINIHPSLLPAFKGASGIKDTFTYGTKLGGVTVHYVDVNMDAGPIIMQESYKIKESDTLEQIEERVHKLEHKMYPKAIALYEQGLLKIVGRKVRILDEPE